MEGLPNAKNISAARRGGAAAISLIDLAVGAAELSVDVAFPLGRRVGSAARPVAGAVLRPPMLAPRFQPMTWLKALERRGDRGRRRLLAGLSLGLDELVPLVAEALLQRIDLTGAVRRHVDLDALVVGVDLDVAAARLDVDAVARRLDVDAVLARLDLTRIVRDQVDLDSLVSTVDLDAAAGRLDLEAVIERIDLVGLAKDVIAELDLPEIIRESTGSVASDTVRGVRMQGITGDQAVGRAVDRLRLGRGRRESGTGGPDSSPPGPIVPSQPTPGATDRP